MAKVTWLGSGDDGPDEVTIYHTTFEKGKAVELDDDFAWLGKLSTNQYFEVEGWEPEAPDTGLDGDVPAPRKLKPIPPVE